MRVLGYILPFPQPYRARRRLEATPYVGSMFQRTLSSVSGSGLCIIALATSRCPTPLFRNVGSVIRVLRTTATMRSSPFHLDHGTV
ncbi:hypothetical protein FOVG_18819 [Fusarium oxysporum f. sp. pisi HDV247]|uniref:Uncharacterized protein n=1 Tax=Fusarium oxysporum f. sp. pisi HDV247 TaxID=1080344 RepID=W9NAD5_FUSOX|nr:hypothetical protein FOVG_18819 [Fusarium oxysporum f. sp. pisi HDV247]